MAELMVQGARNAFASGRTLALAYRRQQLKNLLRMYDESKDEILDALRKDLRKSKFEGTLYELEVLKADLRGMIKNLEKWTKDDKLGFNMLAFTDKAYVKKDPYGVCLILGTWNYPFAMVLAPLHGAIAAGNACIIKPSEMSPACSSKIAELVPKYLDPECYKVFEGDVNETIHLLTLKFDYIFATGSTAVGKSVMEAASKNLTPFTLELGGKSPVYIDDEVDIETAAKRILWGKFINSGQTCIAPDYVLSSKKQQQAFLNASTKILTEWLGENWQASKDYTRIVNKRHFQRLTKLLESSKGRIALGGQSDEKDLYIAPTLVVDLDAKDSLMADEIFGPILPFITAESPEAALKFILERPKPLALYVFSNDDNLVDRFVTRTSSGGVCVNDTVWHNGWEGLPFGGVGQSGQGNYHGKYSVDTFCHKKAVLHRSTSRISEKLGDARYPPYTDSNIKFLSLVLRYIGSFNMEFGHLATHSLAAVVGAAVVFSIFQFK